MPTKLTPKQERFCQKYIETGSAADAYRQSYDAGNMKPVTVRRKAAELLANGSVAAHVRALRDRIQERHLVTVDTLTGELEEARRLALESEQPSAAVSASMGKAKLHGLIVDKGELSARVTLTHEDALKRLADDPA